MNENNAFWTMLLVMIATALTGTMSAWADPVTPTITTLPTASGIECGQTLADSTPSGGEAKSGGITVEGDFGWTAPGTVPGVGTATPFVTFTPVDQVTYSTATCSVSVEVDDTTPPVITLIGSAEVAVECGSTYTDAGATATDSCAGNLTASIITVNPVNTAVVGEYTVTYNVSDSVNSANEVTRKVTVADTTVPVITLNGSDEMAVELNGSDTEAGATATDSCAGNLTTSIVPVSPVNPVNTAVAGIYTVIYAVNDSNDNAACLVRRVVTVGKIYRVNPHSTDPNPDGSTWAKGYHTIQDAVDDAPGDDIDEIWVKADTYTTTTGPVVAMAPNVAVYGGFAGTESIRSERRWTRNVTTIDGQEARRCVTGANNAILDGFTITNGRASEGGGMYNNGVSPAVRNCVFTGNTASGNGGGMYNGGSSLPTIINCVFAHNTASDGKGGGICNENSSSPTVTHCTFTHNSASTGNGGAMYNDAVSTTLTNCILWGDIDAEITGSPTVTYSCIQGGYFGDGNIITDPLFVDPDRDCVQLQVGSPCINTGTSGGPETDLRGHTRPHPSTNSSPDMGAYEGAVYFVDHDETHENHNGASWDVPIKHIQTAVTAASATGGEVWVKGNTSDPYTATGDPAVVTMQPWVDIYGGFAGPQDPEVSEGLRDIEEYATTIDGQNARRCVVGEDNAVLDGFTVTGGYASDASDNGPAGGGMYNDNSSPTVANCTFTDNHAYSDDVSGGGGMCNLNCSTPRLTNCMFMLNSANGTNDAAGGGMCNDHSSPTLTDCTFTGNEAKDDETDGGGAAGGGMCNEQSAPVLLNCVFTYNEANGNEDEGGVGGGMCNETSSPILMNCTFTGNLAGGSGGGMYNLLLSSPELRNCILWGDTASFWPEIADDSSSASAVSHSCIQGGHLGTGNVDADPLFVIADGSYVQLQGGSPCIDAGTSSGAPATDIRGISRPQGAGYDMGAYEGAVASNDIVTLTMETDGTGDGLTIPAIGSHSVVLGDAVQLLAWGCDGHVFDGWTGSSGFSSPSHSTTILMDGNKTATAHFLKALYVNSLKAGDGKSWASAYGDIQSAVDDVYRRGGGDVWVVAGTYVAAADPVINLRFGVNLYGGFTGTETTRGSRDWLTHETIIDGNDTRQCVVGANNAVLDGFTIKRGSAVAGGGMFNNGVSPTVTDCIFTDNLAGDGNGNGGGGGMCNANSAAPTVTNCTFTGNSASGIGGGGMFNYYSLPTVTDCTFTSNEISGSVAAGGGMYNFHSSLTMERCMFAYNSANSDHVSVGGGICNDYCPSPLTITITNCAFTGNVADGSQGFGGGMLNGDCSPTVTNCTFTGNSATGDSVAAAGGMYNGFNSPLLINCTFTGNSAAGGINGVGGGMCNESSSPTLTNCILWGDTASNTTDVEIFDNTANPDPPSNPSVTYSCIQGGYSGTGNIGADPNEDNPDFVDADGACLQLREGSPCIDKCPTGPDTDIRGATRPQCEGEGEGECYDMGAYEGSVAPEYIVTLTVETEGEGEGVTIPSAGEHSVVIGDTVPLFAVPGAGFKFDHWTGNVSSTSSPISSIEMGSEGEEVTATFTTE